MQPGSAPSDSAARGEPPASGIVLAWQSPGWRRARGRGGRCDGDGAKGRWLVIGVILLLAGLGAGTGWVPVRSEGPAWPLPGRVAAAAGRVEADTPRAPATPDVPAAASVVGASSGLATPLALRSVPPEEAHAPTLAAPLLPQPQVGDTAAVMGPTAPEPKPAAAIPRRAASSGAAPGGASRSTTWTGTFFEK